MSRSRPLLSAAILVSLASLAVSGGARASGPVLHSVFQSYPFDNQAIAPLHVVDLNNDGVPEAVTGAYAPPNTYSIIVSKLVSKRWQRVQTIPVGTFPPGFVLSDVSHDGKPDLVYLRDGQPFARVNDGTGTFGAEQALVSGDEIPGMGLTLLEFPHPATGDEFMAITSGGGFVIFRDSMETNGTHDYVQVAEVDDAGLRETFLDNSPPWGLPPFAAEADLNGDGFPDIAALGTFAGSPGLGVRVFMNTGAGSYAAPVDIPLQWDAVLESRPEFIYAADVDGDGDMDLLVDREDTEIGVFINDGAGHFTQSTTPQADIGQTNDATVHGVMVDANGDGKPDYLVDIVDHVFLALVMDLHGNILHELPTGLLPFGIDVADMDNDGHPDLVVLNQARPVTLGVFLGRGGDQFGDDVGHVTLPENPIDVSVGDLDSDGIPDLALVSYPHVTTVRSTVPGVATSYALPATGTAVAVGAGVGAQPSAVEVVTTFDSQQPGRFPVSGAGVLGAPFLFDGTTSEEVKVATGDLNRDGRYDIAVAILEGGRDSVMVWLSNGTGFQPPVRYAVGSFVREIAIADLNGDGAPDILTANNSDATVSVLLNTGNGVMSPATDYAIPGALEPVSITVASIVGPDAYPDVALAIPDHNEVFVFQGDGLGGLTPLGTFPVDAQPVMVRAGDLDADGLVDLVTANTAGNTVSVLAGTFSASTHSLADAVSFGACQAPTEIALGNFSNHSNGSLDVVAIGNRIIPSFAPALAAARPGHVLSTTETDLFYMTSVPHTTTSVPATVTPDPVAFSVAPNPSREAADLAFEMPRAGHATVDVFDLAGRRVARLADGAFPAGVHHVRWDGRAGDGARAPAGVYLARFASDTVAATKRIVRVR